MIHDTYIGGVWMNCSYKRLTGRHLLRSKIDIRLESAITPKYGMLTRLLNVFYVCVKCKMWIPAYGESQDHEKRFPHIPTQFKENVLDADWV